MYLTGNKEAVDFFLKEKLDNIDSKKITFDKDSFKDISFIKEIQSNGFFSDSKVIILDNLSKEQSDFVEKNISLIENNVDTTVFIKKYDGKKTDKLAKIFSKKDKFIRFNNTKDQYGKEDYGVISEIRKWTYSQIEKNNIKISEDIVEYLLEATEYNMREIKSKLDLIKYLDSDFALDDIKNLIKDNSKINLFSVIESLLEQDINLYYENLDKFVELNNGNSILILEGFIFKIKQLAMIYEYGLSSNSSVPQNIIGSMEYDFKNSNFDSHVNFKTLHPYVVKLAVEKISMMPRKHLMNCYDFLYKVYEDSRFGIICNKQVLKTLKIFYIKYNMLI